MGAAPRPRRRPRAGMLRFLSLIVATTIAVLLSGEPKRLAALNKFKGGERSVLIATDVASRGLDIPRPEAVPAFHDFPVCRSHVQTH